MEHKHLIVRAEVELPPVDPARAETWIRSLIEKIGMKILLGPFAVYCNVEGNRGLTLICAIETSSITLHVWDEKLPALFQLDVYSCAPFEVEDILTELREFKPTLLEYKFLDREFRLQEI